MDSEEFALWKAFYRLEPWGAEVDNWRMGSVAATIANSQPRKPGSKPIRPRDFFIDPYQETDLREWTPEQRRFLEKRKQQRKR